jgi:hypothetical protein
MAISSMSYADARAGRDDRQSILRLRVRGEFDEMPGLRVPLEQAARLFGLDRTEAEAVLESLVDEGYLRRTETGFVRSGYGR